MSHKRFCPTASLQIQLKLAIDLCRSSPRAVYASQHHSGANQALLEAYSYSNQPVIINPSPQTVDLKRSRSMDSDLRLSASTRMNEASDQI
ncbi:unnamed protein product [Brassica rapa]|uniref:Uncharacterized protein n=2 Tax=Brassica TaxID=3705 RepID=A0A8D9HTJ5_BRACM|nr:unnamed protein product [Brassica napus]CAG7883768.1 unnamed protein product [Brassica rapa]CAG7895600.1 unnamed protein product [Brassica rapa]CAG7903456.1 unnamed protein product [Brassica rapa]